MKFKTRVLFLAYVLRANGFQSRLWPTYGASQGFNSRLKNEVSRLARSINFFQSRQRNKNNQDFCLKKHMVLDAALWGGVVDQFPSLVLADPVVMIPDMIHSRLPPTVESKVLNDLSHLTLDLFGFLNPEQFLLRLSTLVGRILLMAADYDLDKSIQPDELLYQSGMLALSLTQFLSSWQKVRAGHVLNGNACNCTSTVSFRERVAYGLFFSQFGVSRIQFRMLMGNCIDWVDLQVNETLSTVNQDGEQVAYWLYNGQVSIKHSLHSKSVQTAAFVQEVHHRRGKPMNKSGDGSQINLMSEHREIKTIKDFGLITGPDAMSAFEDEIQAYRDLEVNECDSVQESDETLELIAGKQGATVLQVNLAKLRGLMEDDEKLDKIIRNLILLSIRNRMKSITMLGLSGATKNETAPVVV